MSLNFSSFHGCATLLRKSTYAVTPVPAAVESKQFVMMTASGIIVAKSEKNRSQLTFYLKVVSGT
jgi:hypothetical protein